MYLATINVTEDKATSEFRFRTPFTGDDVAFNEDKISLLRS
jgi:hypothetical protein